MRLIRNGDTDFDGDVDLDDFIPMPGCFTGPVVTDGLCQCRFFDIDHDRDVDLVDLDYLLRNYTGPLEDCNNNGTLDLEELLTGAASDCDLNGRIDSCDGIFNLDPATCEVIPAVSTWGLVVMSLFVLTAGTLVMRRRCVGPAIFAP
ncbi:MAG: IPTL-CTERM sorting domain-containing protein [Armatimonadetes bacterium]|nr:IPTL-CTERM sorting domain-containing protein [Armatimonadota bacterium]